MMSSTSDINEFFNIDKCKVAWRKKQGRKAQRLIDRDQFTQYESFNTKRQCLDNQIEVLQNYSTDSVTEMRESPELHEFEVNESIVSQKYQCGENFDLVLPNEKY